MLGLTYSLAGRHSDAIALLKEAVEHCGWGWIQSQPHVCLAEGYLLAGHADAAERQAARALDLARTRGERGVEAWALRLFGEAAGQSDAAGAAAVNHYHEALRLANELEMRPLTALCHLGLGELFRRTGTRQQAREHLTVATTMCREMDIGFWLEKAEGVLSAVG